MNHYEFSVADCENNCSIIEEIREKVHRANIHSSVKKQELQALFQI